MVKREWTQSTYERYLKEGRGKGTGSDYKPWHDNNKVSSHGRAPKISGWKTNRTHHFLSDNERNYFYILEWSDKVIDIREQFPLLDLDDAMSIANEIGVAYPTDPKSKFPYIMSTDFLITVNINGKKVDIARTVKPASELEKTRVLEKLEIERVYWEKRNVNWGIVVDKDIQIKLPKNIGFVHGAYHLESVNNISIDQLEELSGLLHSRLQQSTGRIREITTSLDLEHNLPGGTFLYLFKHLVARKRVMVDMVTHEVSSELDASHLSYQKSAKILSLRGV